MRHHLTQIRLLAILLAALILSPVSVRTSAAEADTDTQAAAVSEEVQENTQAEISDTSDPVGQADPAQTQDSANAASEATDSSQKEDISLQDPETVSTEASAGTSNTAQEETVESDEISEDYDHELVIDTEDELVEIPQGIDFAKWGSSLKKDSQGRYNVQSAGAGPSKSAYTNWFSIQKCLNMAKSSSGTTVVYIPSGTYNISKTLTVYSNTKIVMDSGTVLKQGTSNVVLIATDFSAQKGSYSLASNITVSGGTLDGGNTSADHKGTLMHFFHSRNITLQNVTVANAASRHAVVLGGIDTANILGCTFRNCNRSTLSGLQTYVKYLAEVLHIDCIDKYGVSEGTKPFDGTVSTNITVQNCLFQGVYSGCGGHYSDYPQRGNGFTVKNCTFSDVKYTAIDAMNYNNINISGNKSSGGRYFMEVFNCTGTVSGNSCGNTFDNMLSIRSWPGCSQSGSLTISNNTFGNNEGYGIELRTTTTSDLHKYVTIRQGVNITNVIIRNNTFGTSKLGGARVYSADNITVSGNTFGAVSSGEGIYLSDVRTASVTGNTIKKASSDGIKVSGASTNIVLASNTIGTASGKGINILASSTGKAFNNHGATSSYTYDTSKFPISSALSSGWSRINGIWYYFDNFGQAVTGWNKINGVWYYMYPGGSMATNTWIGNYYVNGSGAMEASRWVGDYYVGSDGKWIPNRWIKDGHGWWYRYGSGSYPKNRWEKISGQWYYFDNSGYMVTGWKKLDGKWYYLNPDGSMATGWKKIGNKWYYLNSGGSMVTGRKKIGGKWYTFRSDGSMK